MPVSPAPASSPRPLLIVDRYAIYDEIAAGGMATVHFARLLGAQGFRRTVAAKRLLPHLTRDHEFSLMLVDEARMAARIRHPNVVSTLDIVQTDSELVLVMDYVHGESVAKLAYAADKRGESVPVSIATAILIDALYGLHAAHEAKDEQGQPLGLVHRDVSPQNMMVGADGITRIADFGIAKAAGRSQTTQDGSLKGKLWYMAPEQVSQGEVTRQTDVFAASVVLYELLTGQRLFHGQSQAESVFKIMSAPIAAPSSINRKLPPELDAVVLRGLSRDPKERYQTARDMAKALEEVAPQVRPSEIAAWVERIGAESLARRSRILAAVERAVAEDVPPPDSSVDVETVATPMRQRIRSGTRSTVPQPQAASDPAEAPTAILPQSEVEQETPITSASAHAPQNAKARARPEKRPNHVWLALLALVVVVLAGLFVYSQRTPQEAAAEESAAEPQAAPLPAEATPRVVAPSVKAGAEGVTVKSAPPPEEEVNEPPERNTVSEKAEGRKRKTEEKRSSSRPKREGRAINCDPPYSIDSLGRRIFKVECM